MADLQINTANTITFVLYDAAGTEVTGLTDTFSVTISKAGGAFAAGVGVGAEIGTGWYSYELTAAETDTLGALSVAITGAGTVQTNLVYAVVGYVASTTTDAAYTTLANIKARLVIDSVDVPDDAVLTALIEQASRMIDDVSGQYFYVDSADTTRYFHGIRGNCFFNGNLVSVTSIKLDFDGDRTYEITMATTDYDLLPENSALEGYPYTWVEVSPNGNYSFPGHRKAIQVIGKFGWPAVPTAIRGACEEIAIGAYKRRTGENTSGVATITAAGVVLTPKDIPESAMRTIMSYKRLV